MFEPIDRARRSRPYALACWLQALLFAASALVGAVPAPVHAVILAPMVALAWRLHRGAVVPKLRVGKLLAWLGAGCLGVAFAMIGCVIVLPFTPSGLPLCVFAVFQAAVAGFMLTLALYHQREWWLYP
jgi:hypothetical protein